MTRVIVLVLREQLAEFTEQIAELGAGCDLGKERPKLIADQKKWVTKRLHNGQQEELPSPITGDTIIGSPQSETSCYRRQRTYAEHLNASCIAYKLLTSQKPVIKSWDKVLVVYVPGLDFIDAFFECLRARAIPVPVLPPDPMQRSGQALTKMENIAKSCSIMAVLSTVAYHSAVRADVNLRHSTTMAAVSVSLQPKISFLGRRSSFLFSIHGYYT
ncbi:hypothetical protein HN51_017193 [Arachis hypogaea]